MKSFDDEQAGHVPVKEIVAKRVRQDFTDVAFHRFHHTYRSKILQKKVESHCLCSIHTCSKFTAVQSMSITNKKYARPVQIICYLFCFLLQNSRIHFNKMATSIFLNKKIKSILNTEQSKKKQTEIIIMKQKKQITHTLTSSSAQMFLRPNR
jgi:hypothetical protein